MGQTADDLGRADLERDLTSEGESYALGVTPDELTTDVSMESTADDPEQIREEIEQTRSEMSGTIDAIQQRLSPDTLKEQAKEAVRDATIGRAQTMVDDVTYSARQKGTTVVDTVRENPLPAALAAVGLAWLWKNRSQTTSSTSYRRAGGTQDTYAYGYDYAPRYTTSPRYTNTYSPYERQGYDRYGAGGWSGEQQDGGGIQQRVGDVKDTVSEKAGQAAGQVSNLGSQAAEQVSNLGSQAADLGSRAVDQVTSLPSEGMYAVRNRYDQMIMESPLALGLIALGVGAAVGLVVPETEREHQLMGEKKDQLVDRAQEAAQQAMSKVQDVAAQAGDAVQQVVQEQTQGKSSGSDVNAYTLTTPTSTTTGTTTTTTT